MSGNAVIPCSAQNLVWKVTIFKRRTSPVEFELILKQGFKDAETGIIVFNTVYLFVSKTVIILQLPCKVVEQFSIMSFGIGIVKIVICINKILFRITISPCEVFVIGEV